MGGVAVLVVIAALCGSGGAQAQENGLRWRWDLFFEEKLSYDSNVFELSDKLRDRFKENRPGDDVSGRFDDMDSIDDVVVSSRLKLVSKVRGAGANRFRVIPSIRYDYYALNESKSHPTFGVSFERGSRSGSRISLDLEYELDAFAKNYLEDVTDSVGSVSAMDRVYARGEYDEASASIKYKTRLWKRQKKSQSFLDARRIAGFAELGYARRDYDGPFFNRDRNSVDLSLGVSIEFGKRWKFNTDYEFDFVSTDNGKEVLVRDEPEFGIDFNGDGDIDDLKRRTEQRVDRSRMDHTLDIRLRYDIAKHWDAWAGYAFRYQDYLSSERFDTRRGRDDFEHRVRAGVGWDIDSSWSLEL